MVLVLFLLKEVYLCGIMWKILNVFIVIDFLSGIKLIVRVLFLVVIVLFRMRVWNGDLVMFMMLIVGNRRVLLVIILNICILGLVIFGVIFVKCN